MEAVRRAAGDLAREEELQATIGTCHIGVHFPGLAPELGRTARGDRSMMAQCGTIASAETTDGRTSRLRDDPAMERKASRIESLA